VTELRAATERAALLGDKLAAAYKEGATKEELIKLEESATEAVTADLTKALEKAGLLGQQSGRISKALAAASQGDVNQMTENSLAAAEAAAALGAAESAASTAAGGILSAFSKAKDDMSSRLSRATPGDLASIVGIDGKFVDSEVQLLSAVRTGQAITNHLEPSYHDAISSVANARAVGAKKVEPTA